MHERGTSYTAEIETPSGLTFHASVYVPPDAEYADMNEQAEVVQMGVSRMIGSHLRGEELREHARETSGDDDAWAATVQPAPLTCPIKYAEGDVVLECAEPPHPYNEPHRTATGLQWIEPPPF